MENSEFYRPWFHNTAQVSKCVYFELFDGQMGNEQGNTPENALEYFRDLTRKERIYPETIEETITREINSMEDSKKIGGLVYHMYQRWREAGKPPVKEPLKTLWLQSTDLHKQTDTYDYHKEGYMVFAEFIEKRADTIFERVSKEPVMYLGAIRDQQQKADHAVAYRFIPEEKKIILVNSGAGISNHVERCVGQVYKFATAQNFIKAVWMAVTSTERYLWPTGKFYDNLDVLASSKEAVPDCSYLQEQLSSSCTYYSFVNYICIVLGDKYLADTFQKCNHEAAMSKIRTFIRNQAKPTLPWIEVAIALGKHDEDLNGWANDKLQEFEQPDVNFPLPQEGVLTKEPGLSDSYLKNFEILVTVRDWLTGKIVPGVQRIANLLVSYMRVLQGQGNTVKKLIAWNIVICCLHVISMNRGKPGFPPPQKWRQQKTVPKHVRKRLESGIIINEVPTDWYTNWTPLIRNRVSDTYTVKAEHFVVNQNMNHRKILYCAFLFIGNFRTPRVQKKIAYIESDDVTWHGRNMTLRNANMFPKFDDNNGMSIESIPRGFTTLQWNQTVNLSWFQSRNTFLFRKRQNSEPWMVPLTSKHYPFRKKQEFSPDVELTKLKREPLCYLALHCTDDHLQDVEKEVMRRLDDPDPIYQTVHILTMIRKKDSKALSLLNQVPFFKMKTSSVLQSALLIGIVAYYRVQPGNPTVKRDVFNSLYASMLTSVLGDVQIYSGDEQSLTILRSDDTMATFKKTGRQVLDLHVAINQSSGKIHGQLSDYTFNWDDDALNGTKFHKVQEPENRNLRWFLWDLLPYVYLRLVNGQAFVLTKPKAPLLSIQSDEQKLSYDGREYEIDQFQNVGYWTSIPNSIVIIREGQYFLLVLHNTDYFIERTGFSPWTIRNTPSVVSESKGVFTLLLVPITKMGLGLDLSVLSPSHMSMFLKSIMMANCSFPWVQLKHQLLLQYPFNDDLDVMKEVSVNCLQRPFLENFFALGTRSVIKGPEEMTLQQSEVAPGSMVSSWRVEPDVHVWKRPSNFHRRTKYFLDIMDEQKCLRPLLKTLWQKGIMQKVTYRALLHLDSTMDDQHEWLVVPGRQPHIWQRLVGGAKHTYGAQSVHRNRCVEMDDGRLVILNLAKTGILRHDGTVLDIQKGPPDELSAYVVENFCVQRAGALVWIDKKLKILPVTWRHDISRRLGSLLRQPDVKAAHERNPVSRPWQMQQAFILGSVNADFVERLFRPRWAAGRLVYQGPRSRLQHLFEVIFGGQASPAQHALVHSLMGHQSEVHQMLMGGGKTSFVLPLVALLRVATHGRVLVVLPGHMVKETTMRLYETIGSLLSSPIIVMPELDRGQQWDVDDIGPTGVTVITARSLKVWMLNTASMGKPFDKLVDVPVIIDEFDMLYDPTRSIVNFPIEWHAVRDLEEIGLGPGDQKKLLKMHYHGPEMKAPEKLSTPLHDAVLAQALDMNYGSEFGFGLSRLAVPYLAANKPDFTSTWNDKVLTAILTLFSHQKAGSNFTEADIRLILEHSRNALNLVLDPVAFLETKFGIKIDQQILSNWLGDNATPITNYSITNREKAYEVYWTHVLASLLSKTTKMRSVDFMDAITGAGDKMAFSGTVSIDLPEYVDSFNQLTDVRPSHTDQALIEATVLGLTNAKHSAEVLQYTDESNMLNIAIEQIGSICAIIDVAGVFVSMKPSQIAAKLLQEASECKGVSYYSDGTRWVLCRDEEPLRWALADASCVSVTYFDQAHTVGVDTTQPPGSLALVTVGRKTTVTALAQGMFRMRRVVSDQGIMFVADKRLQLRSRYDVLQHTRMIETENMEQQRAIRIRRNIIRVVRTLEGEHSMALQPHDRYSGEVDKWWTDYVQSFNTHPLVCKLMRERRLYHLDASIGTSRNQSQQKRREVSWNILGDEKSMECESFFEKTLIPQLKKISIDYYNDNVDEWLRGCFKSYLEPVNRKQCSWFPSVFRSMEVRVHSERFRAKNGYRYKFTIGGLTFGDVYRGQHDFDRRNLAVWLAGGWGPAANALTILSTVRAMYMLWGQTNSTSETNVPEDNPVLKMIRCMSQRFMFEVVPIYMYRMIEKNQTWKDLLFKLQHEPGYLEEFVTGGKFKMDKNEVSRLMAELASIKS